MGKKKAPKRGKWAVCEEVFIPDIDVKGAFRDEVRAIELAEKLMAGRKGVRQSKRIWRLPPDENGNQRLLTVKFFPTEED